MTKVLKEEKEEGNGDDELEKEKGVDDDEHGHDLMAGLYY